MIRVLSRSPSSFILPTSNSKVLVVVEDLAVISIDRLGNKTIRVYPCICDNSPD